jgi:hypothetical protein
MNKISKTFLSVILCGSLISMLTATSEAQGRSVYFQRVTQDGGVLSAIPVNGPASAIKDLVKGYSGSLAGGNE